MVQNQRKILPIRDLGDCVLGITWDRLGCFRIPNVPLWFPNSFGPYGPSDNSESQAETMDGWGEPGDRILHRCGPAVAGHRGRYTLPNRYPEDE